MVGMIRLHVQLDVTSWYHDGVAFNGLAVDHARVTGGTALPFPAFLEGFHVFPVTHDQSDIIDGLRQVSR